MSLHVVITGGGIGGLCLAQGLRKAGISATVYERDESAGFRQQGYRISLKTAGAAALRECLPEDLFALAVVTSIRAATRMVFLDGQLRPKFDKPLPRDPVLAENLIRAGKAACRYSWRMPPRWSCLWT